MNAFSKALGAHVQHGIKTGRWSSQADFCRLAGTKGPHLTGIVRYGLFPKVESLKKWLENTGSSPDECDELVQLCSKIKSEQSSEASKHLAALHERIEAALAVIGELVSLCEEMGFEVPDQIKKRIDSL